MWREPRLPGQRIVNDDAPLSRLRRQDIYPETDSILGVPLRAERSRLRVTRLKASSELFPDMRHFVPTHSTETSFVSASANFVFLLNGRAGLRARSNRAQLKPLMLATAGKNRDA